ncbi:MAG: hypothetical protein QOE45_1312 [Frankiaceae bacterium]|nr:hypothetical protein [Frankiaceae bacterium]
MLKGDLSATPLSDVLTDLAAQAATGCLHIDDESGDEALVHLKNGLVYAAYVPGRRPQLGARLISSGALAPEALAEALEAQATELQGWRLGELLVHLGYVERSVVEAFVLEQLRESCFDLSRWPSGRYRFRKNEKTREDVGSHATVADLLAEVAHRRAEWEVIEGVVHGPSAVPILSANGPGSAEMTLDQDQWALLCKVDGERTVAQLARDCGFTTFEAGRIVYTLVGAGLLDVEETFAIEAEPAVDAEDAVATLQRITSALFVPLTPVEPEPVEELALPTHLRSELASLTAAIADLPSLAMPETLAPPAPAEPVVELPPDPFGDSLARVSEALNALLGDALPPVPRREPPKPEEPSAEETERAREEAERTDRSRAAAAAELAEAHAMAEAARAGRSGPRLGRRSRIQAEAAETARAEAERAEAERVAAEEAAAEAARVEAERVEAERVAEQAEAERLEAERVAAEEAARLEAERVAAEQAAAEEAARVEAERVAAEEAARVEAERLAAEQAEAARLEAERLEAERVAAEEAARLEAERLAAEQAEALRLEAERVAAEEAARLEAERVAAEHAAQTPEPQPEPVSAFDVASMLRDFNDVPEQPADTVESIEEFVPADRATGSDPAPAFANGSRSGLSETAALLRELTSLGLDDDPEPPARTANGAAPAKPAPPAKEQPKKRKGLFGR